MLPPPIDRRVLLNFSVDAFDESGGVGVGPVGMLRFEVGAELVCRRHRARPEYLLVTALGCIWTQPVG